MPIEGQKSPVVCVLSPSKEAYSETFIQAHIENLPTEVKSLHGGEFPFLTQDDRSIAPRYLRWFGVFLAKFLGGNPHAVHAELFRRIPQSIKNRSLVRFLERERIQAVLAEYGPMGVAAMDACRVANVPLIVHFHGYDAFSHIVLDKQGKLYPKLFEIAKAVIAVSQDMENQLLHLGAPRGKLHLNPCGVKLSLFEGDNSVNLLPIFLSVGRFVDKKAPHLTLLAFEKVREAVPEARLTMAGDGFLWEACRQMARSLGLDNAVEFPGLLPHHEVAALMRKTRAFVQHSVVPSHGDSEGMPVAVMEAGASGIPVVATRHGGIPEVVLDGQTGLLVEEGDIDGMAEAMIMLARDPRLAARMGRAARERVRAEFSMEKSISGLWRIIEEAIRKHGER